MKKKKLRRGLSLLLAVLIAGVCLLSGCGAKKRAAQENAETIQVYLWNTTLYENYAPYIQSQLPDVNIEFIVGNNDLDFYKFLNENGGLPDIITSCRFSLHDAAPLKDSLMNLALTNEAGAVYNTYLDSFKNEDGSVNWLPVCADAHGFVVNRGLFEEYGIPLPTDYASFVSACRAFEKHGIRGFDADYFYDYTCMETLQGLSVSELSSAEGRRWRTAYSDPASTEKVGLDDTVWPAAFENLERFIRDTGLNAADLTLNYDDIMDRMRGGRLAMFFGTSANVKILEDEGIDTTFLPFFGQEGQQWLMTTPYFQVALSRNLEQDSARRAKAMQVLHVMLSEGAQNRIVYDGQDILSYSQNVSLRLTDYLEEVRPVVEQNHMYIRIASNDFFSISKDVVSRMVAGEYTAEQAYQAFNAQLLTGDTETAETVLTSDKGYSNVFHADGGNASFSVMANTLRGVYDSDVLIAAANSFTGSVLAADYTEKMAASMIMPNDLFAYRRTMTGAELTETVRAFVEGSEDGFTPFNRGSLPAVSGIAIEVKEENGGFALTGVTRDGKPLQGDETVTVTCLATAKQMALLLADESRPFEGGETRVRDTWRAYAAGGDAVLNAALPGKPQMLVFACPETQGTYRGFAYDAVAIAYYNNAVLNALDNTAFDGAAHSYVIYPDGRVVLDSSDDSDDPVYNLLAELREHSDLTEEKFDALSDDLAQGRSGSLMLTLRGTRHYLVYENTGIQNWTMLSLVPVSIVNASMDRLWFRTVEIVTVIVVLLAVLAIALIVRWSRAALSRKDTEILYRDELFNRLSHSVDDVFLMLDGETSHADYISPNIERLLGVPLEQVRQDVHVLKLLHDADSPDRDKNFLEGMQRGEQREWDVDYVHQATGERRWFHIIAMGTETAGRTKYILVLSDRTADREVNQALSDAVAAAQSASRAKSDFLTNMSHDIRTPMNAIIGFTTLAVSNISDTERVRDYLTKTLASSRHLLSLINDILDMSRIESGKLHLEESEVSLSDVLHDIKTIISGQVHAKQLELYMDAIDVTDEDVCCDRTRLGQILLNLLSNAIKFTPAGGTVSVRVRQNPGTLRGCAQYEFRIRDTGIGMSAAFAERIFEPFERERTSTVSRIQGTGLGMAITRNIVDMMGGTIEVQTEQGRGTEFTVCLPMRVQTGRRGEEKIEELAGLKALVVDDDFNTCDSVTKLLTRVGMRAEWTLSGREAVLRARQSIELGDPCRAYIIDWRLPDMNGIEVTRQIRSLNDDTPIIILTAYDWSDIEAEARAAGVTAFCSKPMFLSDLRDALLTATGHAPTAAEPDILPEAQADFRGRHVLLVEDNELNREIAVEILHEYGFLVDTAENGAIAVDKVRSSPADRYDLVLMDIQMPVMDGYTATQRIRALNDPARAAVPIVAMTANVFEEERKRAFDCGMNAFLSKPLVIDALIATLRDILH